MHNMKYLGGSYYLVRTQAGFNQALKDYDPDKELYRESPHGFDWPKEYPSVVHISSVYHGSDYLVVNVWRLNDYRNMLKLKLSDLEGE